MSFIMCSLLGWDHIITEKRNCKKTGGNCKRPKRKDELTETGILRKKEEGRLSNF